MPETFATAWTCLFRNLEIQKGQLLVIRGATSSFGQAALKMAVNAGARVIATTRSPERFAMLEKLGAERCEIERRDLSKHIPEAKQNRRGARSGRQRRRARFSGHASTRRPLLPCRLARRARSHPRLQPAAADAERRLSDLSGAS
jgi:threonine dehydrogenase-like Zn-dependent dehydrogenase